MLSTKYRSRVVSFVTDMANQPLTKLDDYNEHWHRKYSNGKLAKQLEDLTSQASMNSSKAPLGSTTKFNTA